MKIINVCKIILLFEEHSNKEDINISYKRFWFRKWNGKSIENEKNNIIIINDDIWFWFKLKND